MADETNQVARRLQALEAQLLLLKLVTVGAVVVGVVLATVTHPQAQQTTDALRVRQLIVEDTDGRARIVLGDLDRAGTNRRMGIRLNDPAGAERFGLAYRPDNGNIVLGLDAPPGTGDDRNRERITLVADGKGGAHIRFLDRKTFVASQMYLDEQDKVWMQFSDFTQTPAVIRRYGLSGDEVIRPIR
jgi:hypothetical protein